MEKPVRSQLERLGMRALDGSLPDQQRIPRQVWLGVAHDGSSFDPELLESAGSGRVVGTQVGPRGPVPDGGTREFRTHRYWIVPKRVQQ